MNTTLIDLIREYGQTQQLAGSTAAIGSAAAQNYRANGARLLTEIEQRLSAARRVDVDVASLAEDAETWLLNEYGTCAAPRGGYSYHNRDHGHDVAHAAGRLAAELHDAGQITDDTLRLAPYAGWAHDVHQGPGHEAASADHAAQAMRHAGMHDKHITLVQRMIAATRVVGVEGHRLIQAADPGDPPQAILADADLSSLGSKGGVYRALLLDLEQQHLAAGRFAQDRDTTLRFLTFQVGLFQAHRYLLPATSRLYPHQCANAHLIAQLHDLYAADRIGHADLLDRARRHAQV